MKGLAYTERIYNIIQPIMKPREYDKNSAQGKPSDQHIANAPIAQ